MFADHFYNATLRKMITVFGALFNNITVVRKAGGGNNGAVTSIVRVPIAYGPKQKFLARIDEQSNLEASRVAIKLPRMSFEIIGMVYDPGDKLNRNNTISTPNNDNPPTRNTVHTFSPYKLNVQLSIMAKNQDDALQVLEQILPYFQPEYTVSVKDVEGMNIVNDIPIVLTGTSISEEYAGDFITRRAIIYTLDFEMRVRFYGPVQPRGTINKIIINLQNEDTSTLFETQVTAVSPANATSDSAYTVSVTTTAFFTDTSTFDLTVYAGTGSYVISENVSGTASGSVATIAAIDPTGTILSVVNSDGPFRIGELITGATSNTSRGLTLVTPTYPD